MIKGLVVWAHSKCRSTYALYREIGKLVPMRLVSREGIPSYRVAQGVREEEFSDPPCEVLGENLKRADEILSETRGWVHFMAAYQVSSMMRHVIAVAKERGDCVVVISEAPWNAQRGWRKAAWEFYLRTVLRVRMSRTIHASDWLVNYSGEFGSTARTLGWPKEKVIPFGYFPAPLDVPREDRRLRAPRRMKVFVPATLGREERGEATVLQAMRGFEDRIELVMPGVLPEPEIRQCYQASDLLIAAGYNEPWGVRVNDALNCGLPVIVSDGMGARTMVRETDAGLVFRKGDIESLRSALREMLDNYSHFASRAFAARELISPKVKARELLSQVGLLKYEEVR